jgi:hypothetical protein|tara:strand:- start:459 stop:725 length:267 start_codon:yes stop_codon:yes gene_type:complete
MNNEERKLKGLVQAMDTALDKISRKKGLMSNYEITFTAISSHEVEAASKDEAWKKANEIFTNGVEWENIDTHIQIIEPLWIEQETSNG